MLFCSVVLAVRGGVGCGGSLVGALLQYSAEIFKSNTYIVTLNLLRRPATNSQCISGAMPMHEIRVVRVIRYIRVVGIIRIIRITTISEFSRILRCC